MNLPESPSLRACISRCRLGIAPEQLASIKFDVKVPN
jgi:hypothetical protein